MEVSELNVVPSRIFCQDSSDRKTSSFVTLTHYNYTPEGFHFPLTRTAGGGIERRSANVLAFVLDFEAAERANVLYPFVHFFLGLSHQIISPALETEKDGIN